jgi:hypothetical protein
MADVNVNGTDITDLVLNLQRGMTLSGRLAFEGRTLQPPADVTKARITLSTVQPSINGLSASVSPGQVDATGAFTLEGILPGRYRVQASMATATTNGRGGPIGPAAAAPGGRGAALPSGAGPIQNPGQGIQNFQNIGWFMKSAIVNGVDALDFPFDVRPNENLTNVLVTFTDQQTEITGSLTDRAGKPVPEFSIIVFSADRRFWTPTSRRIRQARPSAEGAFRIPGLPPGEYYMSAVADFEPGQVNDPAFLDPLIAGSFKFTLAEGEKKTQDLKLAGGGD